MSWRRRSLLAPCLLVLLFVSACTAQSPAPVTPTARNPAGTLAASSPTAAGSSTAAAPVTPTGQAGVPVTASTAPSTAAPTGDATASGATAAATGLPSTVFTWKSANNCNLINSSDLAHLYPPHNEITRDTPKTGPVSQPPFAAAVGTPVNAAAGPAAAIPTAGPAATGPAAPGSEMLCTFFDFHQPGVQTGWMLQVTYHLDVPDPSSVTAWQQAWVDSRARAGQPVSGLGDDAFASGSKLFVKKGDTYLWFESIDTHLDEKDPATSSQLLEFEKQLAQAALERMK